MEDDSLHILWSFDLFYGHLVYFMVIWSILWSFGLFYGHLVYFMVIWSIFSRFGKLYQENSGNSGLCCTYLRHLHTLKLYYKR
jgi:hypothetical protein